MWLSCEEVWCKLLASESQMSLAGDEQVWQGIVTVTKHPWFRASICVEKTCIMFGTQARSREKPVNTCVEETASCVVHPF
jgi:hypothetical protein